MIPGGAISHLSLCLENFCISWLIRIRWHDDPQGSKKLLDSSRNPLGGTTDFEGQLQELFDEVKTMIKMGNENDAIDLLQANYEAVKEQMDAGARGIKQAATLDVIALGVHCYWELEDAWLAPCWTWTIVSAKWFCWLTQYKLLWFFTSLITPLLGVAKVLGSIRRATKAVEVYHCVITIFELSKGAESEDLVVPLLGLGNLLMKEKLWMLKILLLGAADEAIQLYRNALQVLKDSKCMPLDNNVMEKMRIDLAELLHLVGRGKEGCELLEECFFITEKYRGKEHCSLVSHLVNLVTSYS